MRLYELIISDEEVDEVFAISMVDDPAIEAYGNYFDKEEVHFKEIKEEGLFMAPILIPDKKILRLDGQGVPYEVYFSPETIKRLSQMYLEKKYQDSVTIEHENKVEGITLVESWVKESREKDKSKLYGLNVPVGSWLGTFKIDNEEMRDKFRKGEVSAVSIEGIFEHLEKTPKQELETAMLMESYGLQFMDKDVEELTSVEADLVLKTLKDAILNKEHLELESYSDYGSGIKNNAKKGIELNESNGNKCATQTGKVRAQQLAKGESISLETIKRMHSYLSRAEGEYDKSDESSDCANISYLLWGGKAALSWSRNKLRELGELEEASYIDDLDDGEAKDLLNKIHSMLMPNVELAEPSVSSTYPGESSGSISPATI